jgi:hypothetical protein
MHTYYSVTITSVCPRQTNPFEIVISLRLPDKSRVDLTDLGAFEDDFSTVRGAEFLLERVAFEVDCRQVRVRRRRQDWDRVEEVVVCLRASEWGRVYGRACERERERGREMGLVRTRGEVGGELSEHSTHPKLFELGQGCQFFSCRLGNLVVADIQG